MSTVFLFFFSISIIIIIEFNGVVFLISYTLFTGFLCRTGGNMRKRKTLQDLTIKDNFLFGAVMSAHFTGSSEQGKEHDLSSGIQRCPPGYLCRRREPHTLQRGNTDKEKEIPGKTQPVLSQPDGNGSAGKRGRL